MTQQASTVYTVYIFFFKLEWGKVKKEKLTPHRKRWEDILNIEKRSWANLPFRRARVAQLDGDDKVHLCMCVRSLCMCRCFAVWYYSDDLQAWEAYSFFSRRSVFPWQLSLCITWACTRAQPHSVTMYGCHWFYKDAAMASLEHSHNAF